MTTREEVIAAAKEAGFGVLTPYGEECAAKIYAIAFEQGRQENLGDAERYRFLRHSAECGNFGGVVSDLSIDTAMKETT